MQSVYMLSILLLCASTYRKWRHTYRLNLLMNCRYCFCNHCLRSDIRRALQSCNNSLLCDLARVSESWIGFWIFWLSKIVSLGKKSHITSLHRSSAALWQALSLWDNIIHSLCCLHPGFEQRESHQIRLAGPVVFFAAFLVRPKQTMATYFSLNSYVDNNPQILSNLTNWSVQFVDSFIGLVWLLIAIDCKKMTNNCSLVIWAVLDPANPFIAPASAPFVIGLVSDNIQLPWLWEA